jgi:N-acetylneuraminate lyase
LDAGARGGVGSTYNFMPGVLRRIIEAHARGDRKAAEAEQARVPAVVEVLAKRGYLGAAKALMRELGVPIGPARLPNGNPSAEELRAMLGELDAMGYFSWKD